MRSVVLLPAIASLVAAQGMAAPGNPPVGCSKDFNGRFQVTVGAVGKKRGLDARQAQCGGSDTLVATLAGGVMKDSMGRTGSIVANYQFQFDGPPQAGAIYVGGFSVCSNGSIALGSKTTFYQCKSGDFSNVYDRSWAAQCSPVGLVAVPCGAGSGGAGQQPDGQITVGTSTVRTTVVRTLPDGQPQVITTAVPVPIKQIPDGQVQIVTTLKQISDGQINVPPTSAPATTVKQISDGQINVPPTSAPRPPATTVKQISDGQIQITTSAPPPPPATTIKQISDGQIQITSRPPTPPATTVSTRVAASNTTRPPVVTIPPNAADRTAVSPVVAFVLAAGGALLML